MTGNPVLDKVVLGINGLIVLAATALVIFSHTMIKSPATDESKEFSGMVKNSMLEFQKPQVKFPEMVVNLYSRETRLRFVNLIMNIETFEESQNQLVEKSKPLIQDALIDIASNMKPDELNSVTGRILLETRVKNKVNSKLPKPAIKKIYFSKFIVQ
ncbi:MAG: flagellar basal body-associated FliL family protein [Bacteriovoracaceae bacterium]